MKLVAVTLLLTLFTLLSPVVDAQGRRSMVNVLVHTEKTVPRAGFRIKFVEMVEDSRCPEGTNCVWAGNAKVRITVRQGRRSRTFELNSNTPPTVVRFAGYDIRLVSLTPKPAENIRIDPRKYVAGFSVTRSR